MIKKLLLSFLALSLGANAFAQDEEFSDEAALQEETSDLDGPPNEAPVPELQSTPSQSAGTPKPPPPPKKNTKYIQHPNAAKGLVKIKRDGSYIYRTKRSPQDRTFSFRGGQLPPPVIVGYKDMTYEDYYGDKPMPGFFFDYEWMLTQKVGDISIQTGMGFFTVTAQGRFKKDLSRESIEKFTLFTVPLTLGLVYRMNYWNRQFIVPYFSGGGQYIGLLELRDDNKKYYAAGSAGFTGAAGLLLNISRWGERTAFTLDSEYGVNDIWLSLEAKRIQSVKKEMDFSSNVFSLGFTVDM
ncbi:MAG: hypothetical protein AB7H97_12175 [Pseudobdellovibrionaceae bacterium]